MALNKIKRGFTIIEVVLVLAIAGLILLMAIYVFPTVQISQKDVRRQQDLSTFSSAVIKYQNNNNTKRNNLPGSGTASTWNAQTEKDNYGYFNCSTSSGNDSTAACIFMRDYLNSSTTGTPTVSTFSDPDGIPYSLIITTNLADNNVFDCRGISSAACPISGDSENGYSFNDNGSFADRAIILVPGGQCSGETVTKSTVRHFAVLYKLEGAGVACVDNQHTVE